MHIHSFIPLLSADDTHLGRLDYDSLSDQTLMEILFDGMEASHKAEYVDVEGNFTDISEWKALECEDERVKTICEHHRDFSAKQFPFEFIPPLVIDFSMGFCKLKGTMETSVLPQNLIDFYIADNDLYGTINCKGFPRKLESIHFEANAFSGSCILSDLPETLKDFNASENKLSGEICLNDLPPQMDALFLEKNSFTGSVCIERLPETMEFITLSNNKLSGDFRLMAYPKVIDEIRFSNNLMTGTVILENTPAAYKFTIWSKDITRVVDEDGNTHPWEGEILQKVKDFHDD